ncbi:MAG: S8 family serine peptidase [Oscillibacter sp.]|nr:S8 family serine peptidase [Oscillibacter sp.]
MRRRFFARLLFVALLLSLAPPRTFVRAADTSYGTITIKSRNETDTAFSCDVSLSGATVRGCLFAILHAESGQVKQVAEYPAAEQVKVELQNVTKKDSVRILWTDENHMPLANPVPLTMRENNAAAYEQFAQKLAKLETPNVLPQDASDNPYLLARLLVSCDPLPDMSKYESQMTIIPGPDNFYVLQFNDQNVAKDCEKYLNACPSVRYAEPDALMMYEKKPEQEKPVLQDALSWGVEKTEIGEYAKDIQKRGVKGSVIVAVIDSGVDAEGHPSLEERLTTDRYDFVEDDGDPKDEHRHGTHVASTIVDCTPGVDVKIMPVRVLNEFGVGSHLNIISGINYAIGHGANIINLSLSVSGKNHIAIEDAVKRALEAGITVVTAAGNYNDFAHKCCPAHMEDCITVAAVNDRMKRFELSNYGDAVDIAAPGEDVPGFLPGGKKGPMSGTSMAAPHVSAAAALLMCDFGTGLTPAQIANSLKSNAKEIPFDKADKSWDDWQKNSGETSFLGAGFLNMRPFIQSGFYAILYADGEMTFQKNSTPASGRNVLGTYPVASSGDINGEYAKWYANRADIQKVTFAESVKPASTALWFYGCQNLSEVRGLQNLDTSEVTDMSQMFSRCASLRTLDLSALDTRKVAGMKSMFFSCANLTELDLTGWDTKNVTDARDMFAGCAALKTVYASGSFSTEKMSESAGMFQGCTAILGGQNTPYDSAHTDKAYARIDGGASKPGYFKDKNLPVSEPAVTVGNAEATIGRDKTVSVPVSAANLNNVSGLIIQVTYPDGLSVKEGTVAYNNVFESQLDNAKDGRNPLQIAWNAGSAKAVTHSGELATINFDVLDSAKAGTYDITVKVTDAALDGGEDITGDVVTVKGQVTLKYDDSAPALTVGDAEAAIGRDKTVSVPVSAANLNNVAGLIIKVTYPDGLSVKRGAVVYNNVFESQLDNAEDGGNPLTISWNAGSAKEVTYSGELATINFDVSDSANAGTYDIAVEVYDAALNGGRDVTDAFAVDNGQVTLKKHYDDDSIPTLTVGDATVTPGTDSTVTVPVSVRNLNNVAGLIIRVAYPAGFSVKEVLYGNAFESQVDNAKDGKNPLQISWNAGSAKEVTYEGDICLISFNVPETAKAGTYHVTAEVVDASLNGGGDITDAFTVINGTLTIGS